VIEARDVSFAYGDRVLVRDFSTTILRGDRIGLIGPNGSGKTTLLKLLLGELAPQSGEVKVGTQLQVAYFDQYRATLREDWNAMENVSGGQDFVEVGGRRKHVLGYLQDFLFTPERARAPITRLSGGERNRLLLARLFAQPSNLLVMDEPTNDLDIESLELLEAALQDYAGTILLVSHDRAFLDNVVTQTIAAEGNGKWKEYAGGYTDYLRQRQGPAPLTRGEASASRERGVPPPAKKAKLSYKETRELESLPAEIESLEGEQKALFARMHDPEYYRQPPDALRADQARAGEIERLLEEKLERWSELEERA
jgi:ABC transport system ATP-binding/permease protein